jgi:hypothetical protein
LVQMMMAQVQANTADATAARTQTDAALAAQAAHPVNSKRFKPAPPPKFENKDKDLEIRKWLPVIEEHYEGCPPEDYLRLASSHLYGKPRSFYQSKYDAFKAFGAVMADPRALGPCQNTFIGAAGSPQFSLGASPPPSPAHQGGHIECKTVPPEWPNQLPDPPLGGSALAENRL